MVLKLAYTISILVFALICGCGGSSPSQPAPTGTYRVVDLDPGATTAAASHSGLGISQTGLVAGGGGPNNSAFLYSQGKWTDLGSLPGADVSAARAVNANKQALGFSYPAHIHACSWVNGKLFDISPSGSDYSEAMAINEFGQIVGYAGWGGNSHAVLWDSSVVVDLGTIHNSPGSSGANGINRLGQVVGYSAYGGTFQHACIWQNGAVTDLDPAGQWSSEANAINDAGQVVGYQTIGSAQRAALWQNGTALDLGVLQDLGNGLTPMSWAIGINNKGQVVGSAGNSGGPIRGFIWQNGTMTDLNMLMPNGSGYLIVGATGINDAGQIIAGASRSDGSSHAVLLIPR